MNNPISSGQFGVGLMSGTSLDGLDIALCEFEGKNLQFKYKIHKAKTINYSPYWKQSLKNASNLSAEAYFTLNAEFGKFMGLEVLEFLKNESIKPDFIASHSHTIFHQPHLGFSTQLGCGATLAALTGIKTICDFRSLDVAFGGQGAPLVPIGDKLLFNDYQACVNIGGIANISFDKVNGDRLAYDICEANLVLNYLSEKIEKAFDENGSLARSGKIDASLLKSLNELKFYNIKGAKSIGREWFTSEVVPILESSSCAIEDKLSSSVEHIAMIIGETLNREKIKNALFSGGGVLNTFLMERIQKHSTTKCVQPELEIINFKEALIFAFLGYLRLHNQTNTLSSVTSARQDSSGGVIYLT